MILTNFKLYTPVDEFKLHLQNELSIEFLKSTEGVDWYDSVPMFKSDTIKLVFYWDTGVIRNASRDASTLYPSGGASVAEIKDDSQELSDIIGKVFIPRTSKIVDRVFTDAELAEQATQQSASLQREANTLITPLQFAKELDMITEDESAYLKELQRYVVLLSRVASQEGYPRQIEWPVLPTK